MAENPNPDNGKEIIPTAYTVKGVQNLIDQKYKGVAHVLLSEEIVDFLLTLNVNNRKLKPPRIQEYYEQFKYSGFHDCRAFMTVTSSNRLVDGQHRLLALQRIYEDDDINMIPPMQYIGFGEEDDCLLEIDTGCIRKYSDTLTMMTDLKDTVMWAAVRYYCVYRTGRNQFSPTEILDTYNREFKEFSQLGSFPPLHRNVVNGAVKQLPAWVLLGFKLVYDEFGLEVVKQGYNQLYNGVDVRTPFVALRNLLLTHHGGWKFNSQSNGEKLLGYVYNAFNRYIRGEFVPPKCGLRSSKLDKSLKKKLQQPGFFPELEPVDEEEDTTVTSQTVCYGRYRFRNKLEAQWALFLDNANIKYIYQSEKNNGNGDDYSPDFFLPEESVFLEVRPANDVLTEVSKYENFGKMLVSYEDLIICFGLPQIELGQSVYDSKKIVPGVVGYVYDEKGDETNTTDGEDISTWAVPSVYFTSASWQPTKASLTVLKKAAKDASKAFKE